jgi:hypothetical protein
VNPPWATSLGPNGGLLRTPTRGAALPGEAGLPRQAPVEDEVDGLGGTAASLFGIVGNVGLRRVRPGLVAFPRSARFDVPLFPKHMSTLTTEKLARGNPNRSAGSPHKLLAEMATKKDDAARSGLSQSLVRPPLGASHLRLKAVN